VFFSIGIGVSDSEMVIKGSYFFFLWRNNPTRT